MTTSNWEDGSKDDREKPFDPFAEEGDSPFAEEEAREDYADFDEPEPEPADPAQEGFDEPAQLELGDEDQRLPWLEGDPDEEEYEGHGAGQVILLAVGALVLLGLVVGGIWWATRTGSDEALVADGGTIEAPDGPYKVKPEDPGGRVARGTGDTAFAVAEGETRTMQVGDPEPAPSPGFESVGSAGDDKPAAKAAEKDAPGEAASSAPPPSGPGVQVGAYSTRDLAEKGWQSLVGQYEGLAGMRYRIVEGQADIGKVYRLQALPGDRAAADSLCGDLKAARIPCQVKN
ncbi:SPOR domain-containing protein [Novosphingobium sp. PC22D]|uniref:SPOR domain-containing protein n=1 Tax=Novosphingobium sp. PC22D TaxID=1962403 RepID=UPI000BF1C4D3|nr:SPOR domain-containing protein [Novosphingobium sp. PC22D]